jgi:hypothetical protein
MQVGGYLNSRLLTGRGSTLNPVQFHCVRTALPGGPIASLYAFRNQRDQSNEVRAGGLHVSSSVFAPQSEAVQP